MIGDWGAPTLSAEEQNDAYNYNLEEMLASNDEQILLRRLRYNLGFLLTSGLHSNYPEVVGDIALLRYLRGAKNDLEKAAECFQKHIRFRQHYNLDVIRDKHYKAIVAKPNCTIEQENLKHGRGIKAYMPMLLSHATVRGDPICAYWYISGRFAMLLETHGHEFVMEYTRELMICRQIRLDVLR